MNVDDITPEQIRHFLELHQVGWRRGARLMAPNATLEEQQRLGYRIKAIAARDRKAAKQAKRATTPATRPTPPATSNHPELEQDEDEFNHLELEQVLRCDLRQLEQDMAGMREKGSWSALVNATRERRAMRVQIAELAQAREEDEFDPTDINQIVTEILELPEEVLRHPRLIEAMEAARVH